LPTGATFPTGAALSDGSHLTRRPGLSLLSQVAGNYAADILPNQANKKKGFPISLYLDAK
jgi:hypothetical protein